MNSELFQEWFVKMFLPHCGPERPVVLVMNSHDLCVSIPVIKAARENDVILIGLPARTSHILQPLDVKVGFVVCTLHLSRILFQF